MKSSSSRGGGLSGFGSNKFESDKAYSKIIGEIEDIRSAPGSGGRKRLVVKEKDKSHSRTYIDIDANKGSELEKHESYVFDVKEKETSTYGRRDRKSYGALTTFECDKTPDDYDPATAHQEQFSRFGGSGRLKKGKRTKF